jgi:membrane-associated protein
MSRRRRRALLAGVGILVVLAVVILLQVVDDGDALNLLDGEGSQVWQYLSIFLLIAADAVVPVFPSESTLNAASTLAAEGVLELPLVVVLGALGAIAGDSALYWIARVSGARVQRRLDAAKEKRKVAVALALLGQSAPLLIVGGRYVPGLRFVVNATMGSPDIRTAGSCFGT